MRRSKYIIYILALLAATGCDKKEKPFKLPPAGNTKQGMAGMGENYDSIVYVSLTTGKTFSYALNTWDLSFQNAAEGYGIYMNGGNEVLVSKTSSTNWEEPVTLGNLQWRWDNPNGHPDSSAFGKWTDSSASIYIIDLGKNAPDRYKKLRLVSVDAGRYIIQYADMNGNAIQTAELKKSGQACMLYFSFSSGSAVKCEPVSADWDIVFCRYRHVYYDMNPVTAYYVTGALINTERITTARLTTPAFASVSKQDAIMATFSRGRNSIGFDWKSYDMTSGKYTAKPGITYLLKDNAGNVYKLHFTDFYNKAGVKGSPNFEFQLL